MIPVIEVDESNFEDEVLESRLPVLAGFYSPEGFWDVEPAMEILPEGCSDRVKVVRINVERTVELPRLYRIVTLPSWLMFERGTVNARIAIGHKSPSELAVLIFGYLMCKGNACARRWRPIAAKPEFRRGFLPTPHERGLAPRYGFQADLFFGR